MSIVVRCDCTKRYKVPERYAAKRFRCKACGHAIAVPGEEPAEERRSAEKKRSRTKKRRAEKKRSAQQPAAEKRRSAQKKRAAEKKRSTEKPPRPKKFKKPKTGSTSRPLDPVAQPKREVEKAKPERARRSKQRRRKPVETVQEARRAGRPERKRRGSAAKGRKRADRAEAHEQEASARSPRAANGMPVPLMLVAGVACAALLGAGLLLAFSGPSQDPGALDGVRSSLRNIDETLANGFVAHAVKMIDKQRASAADLDLSADPALAAAWRELLEARASLAALASAATQAEEGLPVLLEACGHEAARVRLAAVLLLREVEEEGVDEALYRLVDETDPAVRHALRGAFAARGGEPVVLPLLCEALEGGDLRAVEHLLRSEDPQATTALAEALPELTHDRRALRGAIAHLEEHAGAEHAAAIEVFLLLEHSLAMDLSAMQFKDIQRDLQTLHESL